jgi:hypothetical protein
VIARLSWAALKSLALACKAARAACFERVGALRWCHGKDELPGVDLSAAFPSATRLVLGVWRGRSSSPATFLDANHALLAQQESIDAEHNFEDLLLDTVAQRCPRLTSLQLLPDFKCSSSLLHLPALTQLTWLELNLDNCSFGAFISAASSISGLRDLSVGDVRLEDASSLRGTTTLQRLTRLELYVVNITGSVEFGCLAPLPSLRALCFEACEIKQALNSISHLTQLEALAFICNEQFADDFVVPIGGIAALTNLTSLDIGSSDFMPEDLDQGRLQQLQGVLRGLDKLTLDCFTGVQDAALLASMGCTDLCFGGFRGCAAPAGGAPLLPSSVVRLQLTRHAWLCPLVLRQADLTSLSLGAEAGCSDADCEALAGAFPQLRALQLKWLYDASQPAGITAAGLAHLSALRHLQQLGLVRPFLALHPAELHHLVGITSMRRLVISMWDDRHVREVEQMLAALAAGVRGLRQVLFVAGSMEQREAMQAACDRVVAGCGRQELAMEVRRVWENEAWE